MEELDNLNLDDVLELINDFPIVPRGRKVITTINSVEIDGEVNLNNSLFSETQYVIAVGSHVVDLKPGQKVMLNVEAMLENVPVSENSHETVTRVKIKTLEVKGKVLACVNDNLIDYIDLDNE